MTFNTKIVGFDAKTLGLIKKDGAWLWGFLFLNHE